MRDRERDPKTVGDLLRTMVAGRGWSERMALQRLREAWKEVAGDLVGERTEPVKLARGVLVVRADGSAWASELILLSGQIRTKVEGFLGAGSVREVRVVAGPPGGPSQGP